MILKQGHKYIPMPHDGKVIRRIYRGGRCYYDSPYSPEATQALKAAFPQYWTAISDYGWANPALVPFINEDPMLIVSLVEVGKTRWLVGDGKAYIHLPIHPLSTDKYDILAKRTADGQWIYGAREEGSRNFGTILCSTSNTVIRFSNCSSTTQTTTVPSYSIIDLQIDGRVATFNGKSYTIEQSLWNEVNSDIFLFALASNNELLYDSTLSANELAKWRNIGRVEVYPFIRNGENGMLDILSGTFYPNANTQGAFTIQITDKE